MMWALLWLPVAMVAGRYAHELAHAAMAVALGGRIVRLTPSVVEYELPAEAPRYHDRCIGATPLVSGLVVGAVVLALGPPTGAVGVVLAGGWAVYTFMGDPWTDLQLDYSA